ncbi:MAG: PatA/PatG family cyanobactin maturation protease [Isosphaeraceae bacterium]
MNDDDLAAIGVGNRAASSGSLLSIHGLPELWSQTMGDPRVVVAVLDGPVDRGHRSLSGARLAVIESVVPAVADPGSPATRHGTAVASLIFGRQGPDGPGLGMAPGCRGLIVPIFGDAKSSAGQPFRPACSQLELARAIHLAVERGAFIINVSAGQYGPAAGAEPVLAKALALAIRRGVLVVAAAGNDGCECAHVPAALPSVLAVGAMDELGRPLERSNWGRAYRSEGLLAPGAGLLAARAGGNHVVVAGTSFATAIVSGAAALLWSLALCRGRNLPAAQLRKILLDSARKCVDDSILCRRHLAGRLDLVRAVQLLQSEEVGMSDEFPINPPADPDGGGSVPHAATARLGGPERLGPPGVEPSLALGSLAASPPISGSVDASSIVPAEGCGCAACQEKAAAASAGGLVFALGQIAFDLISEARRDSILQHMRGPSANPWDPSQMHAYLKDSPWEAASIAWTLTVGQTPLYAIAPAGPFAARAYELLRQFLEEQVRSEIEMVSIAGRLGGRARLFNGQVVPVVIPELRGLYSWSTGALVKAATGKPPPDSASAEHREAFARKVAAVHGFLQKIYHEHRNLGVTAQERAMNYAATNAFEVEKVFAAAHKDAMELDAVEIERSPICRPDSDCWDVKIHFFYPERQVQTVRKVFRFTVDVSDVVPVTVGPMRSWFVR